MECLTHDSVLIFLSSQNVLTSLTTLKKVLRPAAKLLDSITNFQYFTSCLCMRNVHDIKYMNDDYNTEVEDIDEANMSSH